MPKEDTQFKKGQVANPAGRPSFRDMIEKVGAEIVEVEDEDGNKIKMTRTEKAVRAQFLMAERASVVATPAFKALAQHLEGSKVQQDNTSSDGSMKPQVTVYIPSNGRETSQDVQETDPAA
jgi:hypothetical protein